jgi:hypothetical protein
MNPDSAGILHGLSTQERQQRVAGLVSDVTLKFNLLNHQDFENDDYNAKKEQAELLCRTVVHLKTLRIYPSVQALPALLHQESLESLGHRYIERNIPPTIQMEQQQQQLALGPIKID